MSIETEITRISTNVSDTLSAVSEMGGEVPDGATSDDMASGVRSIPVGAKIDDTTPSTTTTYSSQKIEDELSALNEANAAQDTEIAKKVNDAELASVAKSGSYNDLTNKPTIPTVPSALPNPNALTFTGAVNETYDGSAAKSVAIPSVPESLKNPNKLLFTGAVTAEYDGSAEVSVEIPAGGYNLPVASATQLGGVMPVAKTDEMTQAVGVDAEGKLYAPASAGAGGERIVAQETVLASGVIPADNTGPFSLVETGLTLGDLRNWKRFRVQFICASSQYCRMHAGFLLDGTNGNRPISMYEWADSDKKFLETIFMTGADGWHTDIDATYFGRGNGYSNRQVMVRSVLMGSDDTPVYVNVYSKIDTDTSWKISGLLKYEG